MGKSRRKFLRKFSIDNFYGVQYPWNQWHVAVVSTAGFCKIMDLMAGFHGFYDRFSMDLMTIFRGIYGRFTWI